MFKDIRCEILPVAEIIKGMENDVRELGPGHVRLVKSIYLEGGDPLAIKTDQLLEIMEAAKNLFPEVNRFACYATAKFIVKKTQAELDALSRAGLRTVFVGLESGLDAILKQTHKGCTTADLLNTGLMLARAGIEMDVSIMLGIGGTEASEGHALATARVINAIEPSCVRVRTFIPKKDTELGADYMAGAFSLPGPHETLRELRQLASALTARTRLLSEHWTNFIKFDAYMPDARQELLAFIDQHLGMPETAFRKIGMDAVRS